MIRAKCPICEREVNAYGIDGRLTYAAHRPSRRAVVGRCVASVWIVEDNELVP